MAIKSEKIQGKLIINEIDSSNLKKTIYDTSKEKLVVTFKNGMEYEEIGRKYKYKKITK